MGLGPDLLMPDRFSVNILIAADARLGRADSAILAVSRISLRKLEKGGRKGDVCGTRKSTYLHILMML